LTELTQQRLKDLLEYDPETGQFRRVVATGRHGRWKINSVAGNLNCKLGYIQISIDGVLYYAHRLAWLYMNGKWPEHEIDHKDLDRANNRWVNLRAATHLQNMANLAPRGSLKWAHFDKQTKMWRPQIKINGKMFSGKRVNSPQEAHEICAKLSVQYSGEFSRTA